MIRQAAPDRQVQSVAQERHQPPNVRFRSLRLRPAPVSYTHLDVYKRQVMQLLLKDDTQVYKQFVENDSFRRFIGDMVYAITSP